MKLTGCWVTQPQEDLDFHSEMVVSSLQLLLGIPIIPPLESLPLILVLQASSHPSTINSEEPVPSPHSSSYCLLITEFRWASPIHGKWLESRELVNTRWNQVSCRTIPNIFQNPLDCWSQVFMSVLFLTLLLFSHPSSSISLFPFLLFSQVKTEMYQSTYWWALISL